MAKPNTKRNVKTRGSKKWDSKKGQNTERDFDYSGKSKFKGSELPTEHKYNDVSWYTKNDAMLKDAASLSYNTPLGSPLHLEKVFMATKSTSSIKVNSYLDTIPGLMSLRVVPTVGVSTNSASPANLAAQNIYSYVRYQNSGAKNYDQADLMLYLLAMDSIYASWNYMKRAYGVLSMYSQYNKYMPKAYFRAFGLDFEDFLSNIADFRMFLNQTAAEISSFCVPAVMSFFVRHSWMFSNVYKDSDNYKAQQYLFTPAWLYKYDETGSKFGGRLVPVVFPKDSAYPFTPWKFVDLKTNIRSMIDAVAYSEDIGVMSGDILKAYGQGQLFKLEPVLPDYTVQPVYMEEVLNQIHNSTLIGNFLGQNAPSGVESTVWDTVQNSYSIT